MAKSSMLAKILPTDPFHTFLFVFKMLISPHRWLAVNLATACTPHSLFLPLRTNKSWDPPNRRVTISKCVFFLGRFLCPWTTHLLMIPRNRSLFPLLFSDFSFEGAQSCLNARKSTLRALVRHPLSLEQNVLPFFSSPSAPELKPKVMILHLSLPRPFPLTYKNLQLPAPCNTASLRDL